MITAKIRKFIACGAKNYGYEMVKVSDGTHKIVKKVKGMRMSTIAHQLINLDDMEEQVFNFLRLRRRQVAGENDDEDYPRPLPKRLCLESARQGHDRVWSKHLNTLYMDQGAGASVAARSEALTIQGPCNCKKCATLHIINVPQVQFKRDRNGGYVTTKDIIKKYRLVLSKRWLDVESTSFVTLPFGFTQ